MSKTVETISYGDFELTLETGELARQASGAVKVSYGDTVLLVTAVGVKEAVEGRDFFPLTVNYQERSYAGGKIPGGYFKREGRPSEYETLTSRLIDRPLRPLFPKGFSNEVQVIATLLSYDHDVSSDVPAIIGASAALALSGMPFDGPVAAARVGYINDEFVLNPSESQLEHSQLNLVVAGTEQAVLMVESEADSLPESVMLDAVLFGHEHMQKVIKAIKVLAEKAGKPKWDWQPPETDTTLESKVGSIARASLRSAYKIADKLERKGEIDTVYAHAIDALCTEEESAPTEESVKKLLSSLEKQIVRQQVLSGEPRIDGRDLKTVRPLTMNIGFLPRTHGSACFTRGETQAMVTVTLGSGRDAQMIDELAGDRREPFMLHYNFPPYCVGEVGFMGSPKRREIGHGRLAKRALAAVMPKEEQFPYVIRVVSEITESNGSSSMATVCGTSLALMDAGVPTKAPVAGIAMGLIKEGDQFAVLTDILGDEDHLGDMDFKVAGTQEGVTALQMDIKIQGITRDIMAQALDQANAARMHILSQMQAVIEQPRSDLSSYAPRMISFKINPDKIRDVIGKGGVTIRELTEQTGATIDIADDGTITIAAIDGSAGDEARARIEGITAEVEIGKVYEGTVDKIVEFGAFIKFLHGKSGLVHISQISEEHVDSVQDHLTEGEAIRVKVLDIDRQGRVRLGMKGIEQPE